MTPLDRLSDEDVRILRLEAGSVRGHTCKVVVVGAGGADAGIDLGDLRTHVAARLPRFPRLRRRLASTPLGLANPAWVADTDFDVARHAVAHGSGSGVARRELPGIVAELMTLRLDRDRPLWRMDVVGPFEDGGAALVVRIHHCLADGMTAGRILSQVILDGDPPEVGTEDTEPAPAPGAPAMLALGARERTGALLSTLTGAARTMTSPAAWRSGLGTAGRLPATLRRELGTGRGGVSPLDAPAGPRRVVAFIARPLDEVKRVSKAFGDGITINDVVLTAIAGGLRTWLERQGTPVGELRAKVPVSLHHAGEDAAASANRDSFLVVDLALDRTDPVERLRTISEETQDRKRHHDADEIDALMDDLARVSRSLERLAERWAMRPRVFAVNVSNVPGPRGDLSLLGAPVREVHSLAEVANRHALRVSAFSAGGMLSFGLCADAGVVRDVDAIASGVGRDLDELSARAR